MTSSAAEVGAAARGNGGRSTRSARLRRLWYVLLLIEVVAVLVPSIYARITPKLFGFPFFYWYQLLWIFISMILTGIVYLFTTDRGTGSRPASDGHAQPTSNRQAK
jgi:hypothetical protein